MKPANILNSQNRNLIRELVASDFKLRYQGSVLGYLWSLLRPLMLFGVLYVVFTRIVKLGDDIPHYPTYLLLGLVLWTFFIEATVSGMHAITNRGDLIRKVSIPKYVIVVSTTLSAFVNLALNMIVVFIFMFLNHTPIRPIAILLPIFILELIVFSMAVGFLLSALYVKFRDLSHLWEVALQVLFYGTPIIYSLSIVPDKFSKIISINPLAQIFQDARAVLITPDTLTTKEVFGSQVGRIIPLTIVLTTSVIAIIYFKRSSKNFAEEL